MSILAIDAGTTGVTALVVTPEGTIAARGYQEFRQHFPKPGWVEHEPRDLWTTTRRTALGALAEANITAKNVGALGLFLPIAVQTALRHKRSPSEFLMPLSFASLLGGSMTLVGTSPIARALIGKGKGDTVEVATPGGSRSYEVLKVEFV